jgi:membrane fusion protein (multidrug efflux system)
MRSIARSLLSNPRRCLAPSVAVALALALAACGGGDKPKGGGPGGPGGPGGGMPPPSVGVVTVAPATLTIASELPGRVEALRTAQVRARVTGIVHKRLFREGSDVKAGQPLFQIDAAPYKAALDSAEATLAKAQANVTQATAQAQRFAPLREANAISQQDYVNAQAAQKQAEADVAAARAAVQTARLNLGYATVTAPISGRIGRALVTEGALVSSVEATQLALIQQIDPVYVNFTQPISELQRLRQSFARGAAKPVEAVPVRIVTDDGGVLPQAGRLLFSDLAVDATSGQVTLRAEVPNPELRLLPGLYVRGRLAQARVDNAVLLPQQAVTRSAQGDSVLVVGADAKPALRKVQVGGSQDGQWVVTGGLQPGEQVIVDGFQKMQPGAPVKPVPWGAAASAPPAAGRAAASAPAAAASR